MEITLLVAAMQSEYDALLKNLDHYKVKTYGEKEIEGVEFHAKKGKCILVKGGVGKSNSGFIIGYMAALFNIKRIINFGIAGSLNENVVPLNVVVADKVAYYDVKAPIPLTGYATGNDSQTLKYYETDKRVLKMLDKINTTLTIEVGTIISGDRFADKENMTKELLANFDNPLSVDMESASLAHIANNLNIPITIIRAISDSVFADDNSSMYEEYEDLSTTRAATTVMHILNNEYTEE